MTSLPDALERLRDELRTVALGLDVVGADQARRVRDEVVAQVDDYLLPRLRQLDSPMLAVVGGSTGAGKSTLVNTLVGAEVSAAGVLRPTTRSPVLVCHPDDEPWFAGDRILPGLPRTSGGSSTSSGGLHLVTAPAMARGVAVLDAPDIDSVVTANRTLAAQLLAAADLWIFVTTAARYADAVPWDFLRAARDRSTAMAVVLNRVPDGAGSEIGAHLASMLESARLTGVPLFTVPEAQLADGRIPAELAAPVRDWLFGIAADAGTRAAVVRRTLEGALTSLTDRVGVVATAVDQQAAAAAALRAVVSASYTQAHDDVADGISSGTLLRGEVLARWQEFVGTGELMRTLEARVGQLRDRLWRALSGRPAPAAEVEEAVAGGVEALLVAAADRAAERVVDRWEAMPGGAALVDRDARALARSSTGLAEAALDEVRAWQGRVLELVAAQGAARRTAAQVASYGVNAAGVAVMVALFAQTGGLTGGEVVVAGGTATVSQKVLEAVFGDQAVRLLAAEAKEDLLARSDGLLLRDSQRFVSRLTAAAPSQEQAAALRAALTAVQAARR